MKWVLGLIVSGMFISAAQAADNFTCDVNKKVVYQYQCTVCEHSNGDGECVDEEVTTCFGEKSESTGVTDSIRSFMTGNIFLGGNDNNISFFLSQSASGYSARLTVKKENVETAISSTKALNIELDSLQLSVKTSQPKSLVGNVTEYVLNCQPE